MNEDLIKLLLKVTEKGYTLTVTPSIESNSIRIRIDNRCKVPNFNKAWNCVYYTNKDLLDYEEFKWIVTDLMLQLEENEKKAGNL